MLGAASGGRRLLYRTEYRMEREKEIEKKDNRGGESRTIADVQIFD